MDAEKMVEELAEALGHTRKPKLTLQEEWAQLLQAALIYAETYAED